MDRLRYKFLDKIKLLPFIDKIYLFGSRARGDNLQRSDIDIALSCPKAKAKDWSKVLDIIENADTLLGIDCIRLDKEANDDLIHNIKKDGRIIFQK